jgi:hypothetical protein|tara:strand:- start:1172 stop:1549 length:378 start_codon:yes stop_codon:yes gene_type:complete
MDTIMSRSLANTNYLNGYCHLFALVAAKTFNTRVHVCFENAHTERGAPPPPYLVHAYIEVDGVYFDAQGFCDDPYPVHEQFGAFSPEYTSYTIDEFEDVIRQFEWGELLPLEEEFIKKHHIAPFM